jgi:predicted nucleotidyltransferase
MISLRSKIAKALLNYFFMNPHESLYVNEVAQKLHLDKRNLVKKVKELEQEGIFKIQKRGNLKLYSINQEYPLYDEYKKIVLKTLGFEGTIKRLLKETSGIKEAYIYGSYACNKLDVHSDIDLLIIGNHDIVPLQRKLNKIQKDINREINSIHMDEKEFKKRIKSRDAFISALFKQKYIKII